MKKFLTAFLLLVFLIAAGFSLQSFGKAKRSAWNVIKNPDTVQMLKSFVAVKKAQAYANTNSVPPEIRALFKNAERGDWLTFSNSFAALRARNEYWYSHSCLDPSSLSRRDRVRVEVNEFISWVGDKIGKNWTGGRPPELAGTPWIIADEMRGAFESFLAGDNYYTTAFGRQIIDSIPPGAVYFGGTDQGRFIIAVMCQSKLYHDKLFIFSQNALTDGSYLGYLRLMYGKKIYIPTEADRQKCVQNYRTRVQARYENHSPKPAGDSETGKDENDEPSCFASGLSINSLLCKVIFDACPTNEFFIEESYPITWMYRRLEPHGLIFRINRQPLAELSAEIVQSDRGYWHKSVEQKIGGWLTEETSNEAVAAFAKKIFLQRDLNGFTGDTRFVQNGYSCKMFSKERTAIAGLYAWRASHSANDSEKKRMTSEADFAFRQAWALCPYSPEALFRYVDFLLAQNRYDDAILLAETSTSLPQVKSDDWMKQLPAYLKQWHKENPSKPAN